MVQVKLHVYCTRFGFNPNRKKEIEKQWQKKKEKKKEKGNREEHKKGNLSPTQLSPSFHHIPFSTSTKLLVLHLRTKPPSPYGKDYSEGRWKSQLDEEEAY